MKIIRDIDGLMEKLFSTGGFMLPAVSHSSIRAIIPQFVENAPECHTVKEIVAAHLKAIGADGLRHHDYCTCDGEDLCLCPEDAISRDCRPAYRHADGKLRPERPEGDNA